MRRQILYDSIRVSAPGLRDSLVAHADNSDHCLDARHLARALVEFDVHVTSVEWPGAALFGVCLDRKL